MNGPLFVANLLLTVAALGATLHAGRKGLRRRHYGLALSTVLLLGAAIWQAEHIGRSFTFEELRLQVHLACAFAALACLPGVIWSGVRLARGSGRRPVHRRWVGGFVILTVLAILTAGWMFLSAEPRAE